MYRMAENSVYASKIEYLTYDSKKRTDLLPVIKACLSFISIKTCIERPLVRYVVFFPICEKLKCFW